MRSVLFLLCERKHGPARNGTATANYSVYFFVEHTVLSLQERRIVYVQHFQTNLISYFFLGKARVESSMKVFVVALATLCLAWAEGEKDDVGTVIGIDLGTTYSWYVYKYLCFC